MTKKRLWLYKSVGVGLVALAAAFALSSTGCIIVCDGSGCSKMWSGCKGKCAKKCSHCKGPCKCGKDVAKCPPDCKKPCCAKKATGVSEAAAPCAGATALTAAGAKKPGCSKPCKKPCGAKGVKVAKCGPNCTKPCCAGKKLEAKAATGS
jgi:hypothetical protein